MDAGRVEPRKTLVPSNRTPIVLSEVDCKTLETQYSDLLLEHTHTAPHSSERRQCRTEINALAAQLGKSNKQINADIRHYEQAKKGGQTIRQNLNDLGVYSPHWNDYFA